MTTDSVRMGLALKRLSAVGVGILVAWVVAFIAARLLANLLFPGFMGQLELATNSADRGVIGVVYLSVWAGGAWYTIRYLLRRWR